MMNRQIFPLIFKIYLILVLLIAAFLSDFSYLIISLLLLAATLVVILLPKYKRINTLLLAVIVFLLPLTLAPVIDRATVLSLPVVDLVSVVFTLPAVYLFDRQLLQNAQQRYTFLKAKEGRHVTGLFTALFFSGSLITLLSIVVEKPVLLYTGILFILYLLGILAMLLRNTPRSPFSTDIITKRIVANATTNITMLANISLSGHIQGYIEPLEDWLEIEPQHFDLNGNQMKFTATFTPPLAGQTNVKIKMSAVDRRGFMQTDQLVDIMDLHIIPRARYAEWLARKYLEQSEAGVVTVSRLASQITSSLKRGVEYTENRVYQPGDPLKTIDWKHTMKLNQVIVREYREVGEQPVIIAVNLSVTDSEAADTLAFNLITVALTMARENIPSALTAYTHEGVVVSTGITEPARILEQTLLLVKEISLEKLTDRHLDPLDVNRIRRNIQLLQRSESESATKLLDILQFQYRSVEESARNHPVSDALYNIIGQVPSPALIFLVSQLNHDAEAIMVNAGKLARRQYTIVPIEMN